MADNPARQSLAMVLERPGQFEERTFALPRPADDEFLLRVELVTICGGDLIEYRGGNRKASYPLLMGHELVGTIESIGDIASSRHRVVVGDRVMVEPYLRCGQCAPCIRGDYHFCVEGLTYGVTIPCTRPPHLWGGYAQYLFGAPGARVHRIDTSVPAAAACLTTVIGNAVRWIRTRGQAAVGEGLLVTGLGVQALSTVLLGHIAGAKPVVVVCRETDPVRLALAKTFGADLIYNSDEVQADTAALRDLDLSLAVECTGAVAMYAVAVDALRPGGRLVAVGTRGGQPLELDLDGVVFKELDLLGGLGQAGDTELAAQIVNSRQYPIERMVSHVLPLRQADEAVQMCLASREDVIHVGLSPWAE